jgi:hypothetical protein
MKMLIVKIKGSRVFGDKHSFGRLVNIDGKLRLYVEHAVSSKCMIQVASVLFPADFNIFGNLYRSNITIGPTILKYRNRYTV